MKIKTSIASLAVAGLIAASPLVTLNSAVASTINATPEVTVDSQDQAIIKTVDQGMQGLRQIHAARIAIFNGEIEAALKHASAAEADFTVVEHAIKTHAVATTAANTDADAYIPFDMSVGLAEGFVPSEEMTDELRKASLQFDQGNHRNGIEVLRLANIDVTVNAGMLPARASLMQIQDAIKQLGESKFYEANLTLKALEESVVFESYSADTLPVQGSKS